MMHLVLAMFETKRGMDEPMDVPLWRQCASYLQRTLGLLEGSNKVRVGTNRIWALLLVGSHRIGVMPIGCDQ